MTTLTIIVKMSGRWLIRLSAHRALNSSLWFFFIIMARRNGAMKSTVSEPQMKFAVQCHPTSTWRMKGRKRVSISATTVTDKMVYMTVFTIIWRSRCFQLFLAPLPEGWASVIWLSVTIHFSGNRRSSML